MSGAGDGLHDARIADFPIRLANRALCDPLQARDQRMQNSLARGLSQRDQFHRREYLILRPGPHIGLERFGFRDVPMAARESESGRIGLSTWASEFRCDAFENLQ